MLGERSNVPWYVTWYVTKTMAELLLIFCVFRWQAFYFGEVIHREGLQ
ncbi:MAG: hypothetical protein ACD_11C00145G0013 [uncultured bacterium]|nr:MAG: hypothetical protein ACD_11C00145G0013 [uncultured bacterium]